jgi:DNA-binding CsgD family transcriptional regulator
MEAIEFYKTPDGSVLYKVENQHVKELTLSDRQIITEMIDIIRNRYSECFDALSKLYTISENNRLFFEFNIVSRFIRCNFGEYDAQRADIDADSFFHFEEVGCPLRGECKYEGIICKPKLDTVLTAREKEIVGLIAKGLHTSDIAQSLNISPTTVNRHRENIKAKLNMRTVAQIAAYYTNYINHDD